MTITPITIADLTTGALDGTGVFDKLMVSAKAHLDAELKKGSIRGPEYSQVYLGQVQAILQLSLSFLTSKDKIALEAELLAQQVLLAQAQLLQVQAQTDLVRAQIEAAEVEKDVHVANAAKIRAETLNVPKQGLMIEAQTSLVNQQKLNAEVEHTVLEAQECKLRAEYDLTVNTTLKTTGEISLLSQKVATEKAQTQEMGVDANSVVGKQKNLYQAQTDGFTRDAEQKAAKILIDTWNARRMTDEGTSANGDNMLQDVTVGRFVNKLASGIGA